ncbi:hypothetical protein ACFX13_025265 [Malus domestica]
MVLYVERFVSWLSLSFQTSNYVLWILCDPERGYRLPYGHQRRWAWPFHLVQPQHNNNAQGGQSRASVATINTKDSSIASAQHGGVQNGARVQPQLHGGSDAPIASMLPGQLKLQPHKEAPELFQRLRLLKNTHYTSEGPRRCVQGLCLLVWVYKPWFHEWDAELLTRVRKKQRLWIQLNLRRF